MAVKQAMYDKSKSVVEMHHQMPAPKDTVVRIARLREQLSRLNIAGDKKAIIREACEAILGQRDAKAGEVSFILQTYVQEEISRLTDAELPRYLFYRYRYETFARNHALDSFPPCLQVEPTSICNYRCVFCYQTDKSFSKKTSGQMGMMEVDTFKQLIDQAEGQCEAISLASRGEPLICREIDKMLAYVRGKFLALKINTNAWFLDEKLCHAILQADINTLVFSVDATSEPMYSQLRVGGSLERVRKNIERFRHIRSKHYSDSRTITRISGVKVIGTPGVEQMEESWGEVVDQVAFVKYNPWENVYVQPFNEITTPCSDLWRRMFVWWDGTVNPCDVDYRSTLTVGKIGEQSLGEIWRSDAYESLRQRHLTCKRAECSPCNRCTFV